MRHFYFVWTTEVIGYYASRRGARRALEPSFQRHWAQANNPDDIHYDFVWAQNYRNLGERAARNSFMREGIKLIWVEP